jgi:transcriptional regulator with XRE-family HTH domain
MDLRAFRESRGLSQQDVADAIGLASKGHISTLETGASRVGLRTALRIETWSGGEVRAIDLLADEDAQLLRAAIDNAARLEATA